jgi:aqualysin 1
MSDSSHDQTNPPWGLDRIDQRWRPLDSTYSSHDTGKGVDVYVIDTGIRKTHSQFTGRVANGWSVDSDTKDCIGQGTAVAGTIGGSTSGVAKEVRLVPVRVVACDGNMRFQSLLDGINWVVNDHRAGQPAVADVSLLVGTQWDALDAAVQGMIADGITVVVAGSDINQNSSCLQSPATVSDAITVVRHLRSGQRARSPIVLRTRRHH